MQFSPSTKMLEGYKSKHIENSEQNQHHHSSSLCMRSMP